MSKQPLPDQIPIFPLTGAILLPNGHLPLNIFEPRYKDMVEIARQGNGLIGMIQPAKTRISRKEKDNDLFGTAKHGRELYNVGCLGYISDFEETENGQYIIILTGLRRFKVSKELPLKQSYREVIADYSAFSMDGDESPEENGERKTQFFKSLKRYFSFHQINIDLKTFEDSYDEEFINTMAMNCPFEAAEKQLLMECPTLADRSDMMIKIIDFNLSQLDIISDNNIH